MRNISLMVVPNRGLSDVSVNSGMTVQDLVNGQNLAGHSIFIDGQGVLPADYASTSLDSVQEVWATGSVKGA